MKSKIIKNKKTPKTYSEDYVCVILEEIKSQFTAFGEGQEILSDKVDRLSDKVDVIDNRLVNVEVRLVNVENRLINVEDRLIKVEDDVVEIKHKLSEKVDREEFNKLEKRMMKLEKFVLAKVG